MEDVPQADGGLEDDHQADGDLEDQADGSLEDIHQADGGHCAPGPAPQPGAPSTASWPTRPGTRSLKS
jgi:hypothetical protein